MTCRDYDIMGYPSLKFFPPKATKTEIGQQRENNLKEIPTDANAVYKSLDNKFKDIKPSSLGDKEYEKKSNEIFYTAIAVITNDH